MDLASRGHGEGKGVLMSAEDEDPIESSSPPPTAPDTQLAAPFGPAPGSPPPGPPVGNKQRRGKWLAVELLGFLGLCLLFTRVQPSIDHFLFHSTSRVASQASSQPAPSGTFTPTLLEESQYLSDIRVSSYFSSLSKNHLLAIGLQVCSDLTAGKSPSATLLDLERAYQLSPSGHGLFAAQFASLDLCSSYFMSFQ